MKLSAAIAALALASSVASAAKSPVDYEREFEAWLSSNSLAFEDPLEYVKRLEVFIANDEFIEQHNGEVAPASNSSVVLGHNAFSHLTFEEFSMAMKGFVMPEGYLEERLLRRAHTTVSTVDIPKNVDWVEKGGVTPVKNQGQCGSCWAFSTTGAVEGAAFVASGKLPNLSEQELVDCDHNGDKGCNGGLMDHAFDWIKENGGICSESSYDYHAKVETCHICTAVVQVTDYQDVESHDEGALQQAVAQQPVAVAIEADQRAFQFYKSGVFDLTCGAQLDHGVLVVGYGVDEDSGKKFWKVKNSWGPTWGEAGYIRLARELGPPAGQCGIASVPSYPIASWSNAPDTMTVSNVEEFPVLDLEAAEDGEFAIVVLDEEDEAAIEQLAMELVLETMLEEIEELAEEQAQLRKELENQERAKVFEFSP